MLAWLLTLQVAAGRFDQLDEMIRAAVAAMRTPTGLRLMLLISHAGSEYAAPTMILILGLLILRHHPRFAVHFVVVVLSSTVWHISLKRLIGRPRPLPPLVPYWQGAGYPSGHTLTAVCLAILLLLYLSKLGGRGWSRPRMLATQGLVIAWPILTSISRVYVDAHWAIDVVGGLIIGLGHCMAWYYLLGWRVSHPQISRS